MVELEKGTATLDLLDPELDRELIDELKELEEVEQEIKALEQDDDLMDEVDELEGELEDERAVITLAVDSLGEENYEITLELDEDPEDMDEEDLELMAELYGELAEAQELGFLKKLFRKVKRGFKKIWRNKWLRTAVITAGVVGAGALAYKFSPRFRNLVRRGVFKAKQKWWAFRRWTGAKKWRIKRWWRRRRWMARVRKLQKRRPRSWWRRLKRANKLRIAYRARARAKRFMRLFRRTRNRKYLNLARRWQGIYRRLLRRRPVSRRRPIRRPQPRKRVVRGYATPTLRKKIKLQAPQVKAKVPTLNIQQQQQAGLQKALMPLILVGGGLTLLRFMRG